MFRREETLTLSRCIEIINVAIVGARDDGDAPNETIMVSTITRNRMGRAVDKGVRIWR